MKTVKSAFVILCFMFIFQAVKAQNGAPLTESAITKKTSENISKGLDPFTGLNSTFFITYQERPLKDLEIQRCSAEIKEIPGTSISFNTSISQIIISCPKQKDSPMFATYKEILAKYEIRIMEDKEYLYEATK